MKPDNRVAYAKVIYNVSTGEHMALKNSCKKVHRRSHDPEEETENVHRRSHGPEEETKNVHRRSHGPEEETKNVHRRSHGPEEETKNDHQWAHGTQSSNLNVLQKLKITMSRVSRRIDLAPYLNINICILH
ncbi:hypothetical protein AVEN_68026-1 [Araneus ventricosus]|uniref:Uncharacterized protein n=1 Tax=Araneus ventricosus TaxID=182803 RepID=A0A4Y2TDP0_ARAVE|nr:hypothetical protein AVEN_68026-1 [Araneus ventricosus]